MSKEMSRIAWDDVPEPESCIEKIDGKNVVIIPDNVEVVYMLGDKEQINLYSSGRMDGIWEFLSGCYQRKINADFDVGPKFDKMIAYLLDENENRTAIIEEKSDFKLHTHY